MPIWMAVLSVALLAIMLARAAATVVLARRYHRGRSWEADGHEKASPSVTVIVPAFNEQRTVGNCLTSLARQTYRDMDVLVVDDGSTDGTSAAAERAAGALATPVPITVTRKANGGKASALNFGVLMTAADVVVCVDADSVLAPDAIERIIEPFADPTVGAVGGTVKVANTRTVLGRLQAMEYVSGLSLQRSAFAQLGSVQVLSGALSAFRRDVIRSFGGYSHDTIVEDFDITVTVQASGHRAELHPGAVAFTEAPLTIRDLGRQRYRWTYGAFQVLGKHRSALFTSRYGNLSKLGLPYFLIFPWLDVLGSLLSLTALIVSVAAGGLWAAPAYVVAISTISLAMNVYALHLTGGPTRLALWGLLSPFFYAHVLTWTTARAGWGYLTRRTAAWDSLERAGHNVLDPANAGAGLRVTATP